MKILEMKHIKKSFSDKTVLQDIDLSVETGEVVSILGPSGSGKSTLLRCATFLETVDSGEISYSGKAVVTNGADGRAVYPNATSWSTAPRRASFWAMNGRLPNSARNPSISDWQRQNQSPGRRCRAPSLSR